LGLILFWIDVGDDQDDNEIIDFAGLIVSGAGVYYSWKGDISSITGKISMSFSFAGMITCIVDVIS
jgi:hypothetical protein